ncbi:MAG: coiled-coil domain-containing protein [Patescibacteria group bacterium]
MPKTPAKKAKTSKKTTKNKQPKIPLSDRFINWIGSEQSLVVHTAVFIGTFSLLAFGVELDKILLVLTTVLSLEAIYLAIFIQIAINRNTQSLQNVEKDIDEIQEDIDEIQEDIDEIQEDVDEIQEDVDEIQEDVELIEKDIDEIHEEEILEEDEAEMNRKFFLSLESQLQKLIAEMDALKKSKQGK